METIAEKRKIHHGNNVRLARTWKKVTQDDLADRLNIYQSEVSKLETQELIDEKILAKISTALEIPIDFLKEFEPEAIMKSYNQYESKIEITSAENSNDNILQQGEQNITNHYYPIEKVEKLYERLLQEKEQQIQELKARLK
jgi:transcriptional regulator with XRE-family HTH domain